MDLARELGERDACQQVGCSRATFRRHHILEPCEPEGSPEASEGGAQQPSRQLRRYQLNVVKTRGGYFFWDKPVGNLSIGQAATGV
jgi:hypothetical protein